MKKFILLISLLGITCSGFSQSLIAKIKYEDAEAAYLKQDYKLAIAKLNETEAILKATNPRILYLRVMAQFKMIESGSIKDFAIIESTRKLSSDYLDRYETVPNNEDKFRDIYKVSEALMSYPKTAAEFAAKEAERKKYEMPAGTLEGLLEQFKFKLDFTVEQFKAYNPEGKNFMESIKPFQTDYYSPGAKEKKGTLQVYRDAKAKKGILQVWTDAEKVAHYEFVVTASDDNAYLQQIFKSYSDLLIKLSPTPERTTSTETVIGVPNMGIGVKIDDGRVIIQFGHRES